MRDDRGRPGWPSHIRSTSELDRLRAQLAALMPYWTAAEVLEQVFPVDAGADPETLRLRHTFKIAQALPAGGDEAAADRRRGDRRDLGCNLHPELRGRRPAHRGPDRQCRDDERRTAGLRCRGED